MEYKEPIIDEPNEGNQYIMAYTDPFLLLFPELELFIWRKLISGDINSNHNTIYLDIFTEPTVALINISLERTDVVNFEIPEDIEYDIATVYSRQIIANKYQYIDVLSEHSGNILCFDIVVPVNNINSRIGQVVVLSHPGQINQVITVCGIDDLN